MDVSLGPHEALLSFDCLHLHDAVVGRRLAAALKVVLEVTKVWQLGNRRAGVLFWHLADAIALAAHRYATAPLGRWLKARAAAAAEATAAGAAGIKAS